MCRPTSLLLGIAMKYLIIVTVSLLVAWAAHILVALMSNAIMLPSL